MNESFRIDTLNVLNYRGFEAREFRFSDQFNVLIGDNATGKTGALEALRVAAGSWFIVMSGAQSQGIRQEDIREIGNRYGDTYRFEKQYPVVVRSSGCIRGKDAEWTRSISGEGRKTTSRDAKSVTQAASYAERAARAGESVTLPLVSYYGVERLSNPIYDRRPRSRAERALGPALQKLEGLSEEERASAVEQLAMIIERSESSKTDLSRFAGYRKCLDQRTNHRELKRWFEQQAWRGFQDGTEPRVYRQVRALLSSMIEGATDIGYDASYYEVVVEFGLDVRRFSLLSDGQRSVLALAGDIAIRMAQLNPHLGEAVFDETPGVVLIDELDMHLHPTWQRRIAEQLRTAFPNIQFIATSHSPFIVQSLREGELISLDTVSTPQTSNLGVDDIAEGLMDVPPLVEDVAEMRMGVDQAEVSARYLEMKLTARAFLKALEAADLTERERYEVFQRRLAEDMAPYADNPAFQAFLEMKLAAKAGV